MAISPQQLTIYLYSAHRAVTFAIAQLSCLQLLLFYAKILHRSLHFCAHRNPISWNPYSAVSYMSSGKSISATPGDTASRFMLVV